MPKAAGRKQSTRAGSPAGGNGSAGAIRQRNVEAILKAAEQVFSKQGFSGASTAEIAAMAKVPKANLHYYFRTKQDLYARVLDTILSVWLDAMDEIQPDADPAEALSHYIARKIAASRESPDLSRIWAMELIGGARHVQPFLRRRLRALVREKSAVIEGWIAAGRIVPVDPAHLLFMIWSVTQTYADFSSQIAAVLGRRTLDARVFDDATVTVSALVLRDLGLLPMAAPSPPARQRRQGA